MPFNRMDKYRTYWTSESQFELTMFSSRPVFYKHGLDETLFGRAGTLEDHGFRTTPDGLYGQATIEEGRIGDVVLDLVARRDAAWSTGTMPHMILRAVDGYIARWPIVEASVVRIAEAGSYPGTTTVHHVRSILPVEILPDDESEMLTRSQWVMPTEEELRQQREQQTEFDAGALARLERRISDLQDSIDNMPAVRAVPAEPPPVNSNTPAIRVASKYDDVSLFGMLFRDEYMRLERARRGRTHTRDDEFMRSLVDKMRRQHELDQARPILRLDDAAEVGVRAIDAVAYNAWHDVVPHLRADEAMQSTLAGSGDELVPTLMSTMAYYEFRMASRVWSFLPSFQLPSVPFEWPTISGGPKLRRALEPEDRAQLDLSGSYLADGKPTTGKITFTPGMVGVMSLVSEVLMEDAGINVADMLATQFARNVARDVDWILLNGDERITAANISHTANPTGTEWDYALTLDGLRRIAQANSDNASVGTIGPNSVTAIQKLMGARGIIGLDISNLAIYVDPGFMYALLDLADFQTVDMIGDRAVLLTGQVGSWKGIPVIVSDELELTADTGLYPTNHTAGTKGQMVIPHRNLLRVGFARNVTYEQGRIPHTGLYAMSVTLRLDMQAMEAGAVGWGYNATV